MGAPLVELEQALRSQKEKMTLQEENVLLTCKAKAIKEFAYGLSSGAVLAWAVSWKLNRAVQVALYGGASVFFGLWRFNRALDSCLDHILSLDGSRLQKELAKVIVNNHQDERWTMQIMNRHFYSEKIFDDSSSDKANIRFRYRNFFTDDCALGQKSDNDNSYAVSNKDTDTTKADVELKQVPMNPVADGRIEDPLDSIFGFIAPVEEIHHPGRTSKSGRVLTRSRRRSHRKHRVHHHEV